MTSSMRTSTHQMQENTKLVPTKSNVRKYTPSDIFNRKHWSSNTTVNN